MLTTLRMLPVLAALTAACLPARSQEENSIGYSSVSAALEALGTRSDVFVSIQRDWTVIADRTSQMLWSFTPFGHPAHPSVVKRRILSIDGTLDIQTTALCEASEADCKALVEEFRLMNERMSRAYRNQGMPQPVSPTPTAGGGDPQWRPSREQERRFSGQSRAYFAARDAQQYGEAWALLSPERQRQQPLAGWTTQSTRFRADAGELVSRSMLMVTWAKDPASNVPGVYVTANFLSHFDKIEKHCGYFVWHEQADGSLRLLREEQSFVGNDMQRRFGSGASPGC